MKKINIGFRLKNLMPEIEKTTTQIIEMKGFYFQFNKWICWDVKKKEYITNAGLIITDKKGNKLFWKPHKKIGETWKSILTCFFMRNEKKIKKVDKWKQKNQF